MVFVPNEPFQPCLIFARKGRHCPIAAPFRLSPLGQVPGLACKYRKRLERFVGTNTQAFFAKLSLRKKKRLINLSPGVNSMKLFFFINYKEAI